MTEPFRRQIDRESPFQLGQQYNVATPQMGLKSKAPWVGLTFAHRDTSGRIKQEITAADGNSYFVCSLAGYGGTFLFRIEGEAAMSYHRAEPRYLVTLFAIL